MLLQLSATCLLPFCHHLTGRGRNRLLTGQGNACRTHHSGQVFFTSSISLVAPVASIFLKRKLLW